MEDGVSSSGGSGVAAAWLLLLPPALLLPGGKWLPARSFRPRRAPELPFRAVLCIASPFRAADSQEAREAEGGWLVADVAPAPTMYHDESSLEGPPSVAGTGAAAAVIASSSVGRSVGPVALPMLSRAPPVWFSPRFSPTRGALRNEDEAPLRTGDLRCDAADLAPANPKAATAAAAAGAAATAAAAGGRMLGGASMDGEPILAIGPDGGW